jgi:hypothetical protein
VKHALRTSQRYGSAHRGPGPELCREARVSSHRQASRRFAQDKHVDGSAYRSGNHSMHAFWSQFIGFAGRSGRGRTLAVELGRTAPALSSRYWSRLSVARRLTSRSASRGRSKLYEWCCSRMAWLFLTLCRLAKSVAFTGAFCGRLSAAEYIMTLRRKRGYESVKVAYKDGDTSAFGPLCD